MKKLIIIGIQKHRTLFTTMLGILLLLLCISTTISWFIYSASYPYQRLKDFGYEVEAIIVDIQEEQIDPFGNGASNYNFYLIYEYTAESGVVYQGRAGRYNSFKSAKMHLGELVIITVEPNGFSSYIRLKDLKDQNFSLQLTFAIFISLITIYFIYLFFYRGFYRDRLNHKLVFNGSTVATGEVIKTWGLLLKRVKVRYTDLDGKVCEAWARHLFKVKEARFLADKKFINIRIAKNRYGIDEVMTKD